MTMPPAPGGSGDIQQLGAVAICGSGKTAVTRVCLTKTGTLVSGCADGTLQVRTAAPLS